MEEYVEHVAEFFRHMQVKPPVRTVNRKAKLKARAHRKAVKAQKRHAA